MTIVPCIWFLEFYRFGERVKIKLDLERNGPNMTESIAEEEKNSTTMFAGVTMPIVVAPSQWIVMIEQVLLFILIVGRWLLPKGEITRDELSQLLMVYLGMAADIIEFFETFKEEKVMYNRDMTVAILAIWSASLLQFTLVVTASKSRKTRAGFQGDEDEQNEKLGCGSCRECFCFDTEVFGILTTMFLQDAPFFSLRLLLIVSYNVMSYMHLFFTIKNGMVLVILLYRLSVIAIKRREKKKKDDYDEIDGS